MTQSLHHIFVVAILACIVYLPGSRALYLDGDIRTLNTWTFLARFCFLSNRGQLRYTFTFPVAHQPIQLLLYYDEPSQWPAVYKSGMTCDQMTSPPHIIPENNQAIVMDLSYYWSGCTSDGKSVTCEAVRNFESSRARWWYLAISRCQNSSTQGIQLSYAIHMTNSKGNDVMFQEFSADEFYILQVDIACLCIMSLILGLASLTAYELKKRLMLHTSFKMYLTSLAFAVFFLFIECIAYGQFANTGRNNDGLKMFGHVSEVISILVFVLMLLLLGKGFTVTRGRISTGGSIKIAIFITLYTVTYAILFFYQAMFFDPGLVLYVYASPPGYGILVLRVVAWVYFSYACFFTLKHYPDKSKFYYPFYVFYSIWFLIGPLFVIIAYFAWPDYCRATIVNGVDAGIAILAHAFLLYLTRPSNSNKNFPFHVRTSQIGIMRDPEEDSSFPSYPYAPSANYSSHIGPNFSSLFNVAKDVYQQEPSQSGQLTVANQPRITRQPENGQVPMRRFPHENGDPAESSAETRQQQETDVPPRRANVDPFVTYR